MKIVLATDGSSGAKLAQVVMEKLPLAKRTRITAATAIRGPAATEFGVAVRPTASAVAGDVAAWQQLRESRREMLDLLAANLNEEGFVSDSLLLDGDPADQLLKLAREDDADLIVTGSGESSDFSALFLGSVSRKLALNSEASVLIGRSYRGIDHAQSIEILNKKEKLDMVVAYDGSPGSDVAINTLGALRRPVFGKVTVLAIEPIGDLRFEEEHLFSEPLIESNQKHIRLLAEQAAHELKRCADICEPVTGFGRPSVEIGRIAELKNADLVILGANRHAALERWLLGSCAYETATSAPCSVLILRDRLHFEEGQEG